MPSLTLSLLVCKMGGLSFWLRHSEVGKLQKRVAGCGGQLFC